MKRVIPFILLALPVLAPAEIYKWTDDQGRVHFGDKPTDKKVNAQEVQVRDYLPGTDAGTREIYERRQRLLNAGADADKKKNAAATAAAPQADQRCQEAKEELLKISGPVSFKDEKGNEVHVTERKRIQKQQELATWIRTHCP